MYVGMVVLYLVYEVLTDETCPTVYDDIFIFSHFFSINFSFFIVPFASEGRQQPFGFMAKSEAEVSGFPYKIPYGNLVITRAGTILPGSLQSQKCYARFILTNLLLLGV